MKVVCSEEFRKSESLGRTLYFLESGFRTG